MVHSAMQRPLLVVVCLLAGALGMALAPARGRPDAGSIGHAGGGEGTMMADNAVSSGVAMGFHSAASMPEMAKMAPPVTADAAGAPMMMRAGAMHDVAQTMLDVEQRLPEDAIQGSVVIKSGYIHAHVESVRVAVDQVTSRLESWGGFVENLQLDADPGFGFANQHYRPYNHAPDGQQDMAAAAPVADAQPTNAQLTARVPADKFDAFVAHVRSVVEGSAGGRVLTENVNARDETAGYVDTVTRQGVEEKSLAQLETLLQSAATVGDLLAVKREMDAVTQRLESAKAHRNYLERSHAMSTVNVQFSRTPPPPWKPALQSWSALDTFGRAFGALLRAGQACVDLLIFSSVFAVPLALVFALVKLVAPTLPGMCCRLLWSWSPAGSSVSGATAPGTGAGSRDHDERTID